MDIHNYIIYLHDLIRDPKMIPKMQIIVLSRLMIDLEIMANLWSAVTMNWLILDVSDSRKPYEVWKELIKFNF